MLLQCPACLTKYRVDDAKVVPSSRAKVRCARCKHIFPLHPDYEVKSEGRTATLDEQRTKDPHQSSGGRMLMDQFDGDLPRLELKPRPISVGRKPVFNPAEELVAIDEAFLSEELAGLIPEPGENKSSGLPDQADEALVRRGTSSFWVKFGLGLLIMVGFVIAAVLLVAFLWSKLPQWTATQTGTDGQTSEATTEAAVNQGKVQNIELLDVRQYFVDNSKIGPLCVIEGKAINRYPEAKELIRLEVNVFNAKGKSIGQKVFLAGNSVTLFQLQVLTQAELEGVLNGKVGVIAHNTHVQPGASVPFMVVFYVSREVVQEYSVRVVDSQDAGAK